MNFLDLSDTKDRHLGMLLTRQAEQNGETVFLLNDDLALSYAEAENIANRLAKGLQQLGVGHNDRIAFFMSNRPEMVLLCLAANKLGAIWVPICTDYKGEWLRDALWRSEPRVIVTDGDYYDAISGLRSDLPVMHTVVLDGTASNTSEVNYTTLIESEPLEPDYSSLDYGDTSAILWTSGTTGKSKGVMVAHNNWVRSTLLGTALQYNVRPGDIIYCAMPLYNAGAWITCVIRALIKGIGCAIEKKFSVSNFMRRIKFFNATQTFAVGSMGVFLMGTPEREDDADNPLREAAIVPMSPDMWEAFEKRFGVHLVTSGLGQSECLLILNHVHSDRVAPRHALGWPPPDAEVKLFDDDGVEVTDGQVGEICVRPLVPHALFNGYFNDEEATAAAYRGDWFLTGDMGRKDPENGVFYFVDRKKDAVRFAGRNISTLEVEGVAMRHPKVTQVAAFGIPSEALTSEDELKLNVVRSPGSELTAEELCAFINANAPHYFVPRYLEFVDSLPYTPTNKVQKFKLREAGITPTTWDLKASEFQVVK